jgi:hypothetical protein
MRRRLRTATLTAMAVMIGSLATMLTAGFWF